MPAPYSTISIALLIVFLAGSCDMPECRNMNPVFDTYPHNHPEYKRELVHQLRQKSADELTYWFDTYFMRDGAEYIRVFIRGDHVCAKADMLVTDWGRLPHLKKEGSGGYHGAEIKGLKLNIVETAKDITFVYTAHETIVD